MRYTRAIQPTAREAILCGLWSQNLPYICRINDIMKPKYTILWSWFNYSTVVANMKFNGQNSENLWTPLIFAPCGPPYDPADSCAACGWFKLQSPGICTVLQESNMLDVSNRSTLKSIEKGYVNDQKTYILPSFKSLGWNYGASVTATELFTSAK